MRAKTLLTILAISIPCVANADAFNAEAKVISADPVYSSSPVEACQSVPQPSQPSSGNSMLGTVIGGVAGALLGSQVGNGNGRVAAAAVGAVAGSMAGNAYASKGQSAPTQSCTTVQRKQITGYDVSYEYAGLRGETITSSKPGQKIPVSITVTPQIQ